MTGVVAAIDLGTNSVLLTIARRGENGTLDVLDQKATVTRLGQGVDQSRTLLPAAAERTLACLREYRKLVDRSGAERLAAVGTSALRDARGGEGFVRQATHVLGCPLEVISGEREAHLTFQGALSGMTLTQGRALVFDIGGGSTEFVLGDPKTGAVSFGVSLDVGSVRLTERHELTDPPTEGMRKELLATISAQLDQVPFDSWRDEELRLVGVAGTVTSLAAIARDVSSYDPNVIHGAILSSAELHELTERIFFSSSEERLTLPGLHPGRADVIGAGALLCSAIVQRAGNRPLVVSDRGVRFGLLEELTSTS